MEETPPFDSAIERLQRFLSEQGWPTRIVWRLESDVVRVPHADIVVRRRTSPDATRIARAHYEAGRSQGVGVALEVSCEVDGAACTSIFWTADPTEAEYRMMPERGLKLSVATPHRPGRSVSVLRWWLSTRRARARDKHLRQAMSGLSNREDPLQVSGDIVNTRPSGTKPR